MRVLIHQPEYLPWIGYFDKIDKSDLFVLLDHVQFERRGFQNRNKIKMTEGPMWLTVPIVRKFGDRITDVKIDNSKNWRLSHLNKIYSAYKYSEFLNDFKSFIESSYEKEWTYLCELNIHIIKNVCEFLGLETKIIRSSELEVGGTKNDLLVNICKIVGANEYFSGTRAKDYMDVRLFEKNDIKVIFHDFVHPIYKQQYGQFLPLMSIIDMIFNCGEETMDMIRQFNP